jgi:hypothetical protein
MVAEMDQRSQQTLENQSTIKEHGSYFNDPLKYSMGVLIWEWVLI